MSKATKPTVYDELKALILRSRMQTYKYSRITLLSSDPESHALGVLEQWGGDTPTLALFSLDEELSEQEPGKRWTDTRLIYLPNENAQEVLAAIARHCRRTA